MTPDKNLPKGKPGRIPQGVFTYTLFEVLAEYPQATYGQIGQEVLRKYATKSLARSTPMFEGDLDQVAFAGTKGARVAQWAATRSDDGFTIPAGSLHGLAAGDVLAVMASAADPTDAALGYVALEAVDTFTATAKPVVQEGKTLPAELPKGLMLRKIGTDLDFSLTVALPEAGSAPADALTAAMQALISASALGQQQFRTAEARPPHLVCCVPLVSGLGWRYPTFHPGGVLREEYVAVLDRLGFGTGDLIRGHPRDDAAWGLVRRAAAPERIDVPVLMIGGWFDLHPDEMVDDFRTLCQTGGAAARDEHRLLIGPWTHHVSASYANDAGELPYAATKPVLRQAVRRWFDRWLRGVGQPATPRVTWFALGADVWRSGPAWPPVAETGAAASTRFFLAGDHRLLHPPGPATAPPLDPTYAIVHDPAPTGIGQPRGLDPSPIAWAP